MKQIIPDLDDQICAYALDPLQVSILTIDSGLINGSYKISDKQTANSYLLQRINTTVFLRPEDLQTNYTLITNYLQQTEHQTLNVPTKKNEGTEQLDYLQDFFLSKFMQQPPSLIKTRDGKMTYIDPQGNYWRMFKFVDNCYVLNLPIHTDSVYQAALCFGNFTQSLRKFDETQLKIIIPQFHNLAHRYDQFQRAISSGALTFRQHAAQLITQLLEKSYITDFFKTLQHNPSFKMRVMHHDAKLSNILFYQSTGKVACLIDLDTVMPGLYFSDLGDMFRSMACSESENCIEWEKIAIRPDYYAAILRGYMEAMEADFTPEEIGAIHASGLIMIYQQALRFLTDYLLGNKYYKINYLLQNYDRAMNQFMLLQSLEIFLKKEYGFILTKFPQFKIG